MREKSHSNVVFVMPFLLQSQRNKRPSLYDLFRQFYSKTFTSKSYCKLIQAGHEGIKPYECTVCNLKFATSFTKNTGENHKIAELNQHVTSVHKERKPFKCEVCSKKA